jgi:hypothetical protein
LVETGAEGNGQATDVVKIAKADDLRDIANLGVNLDRLPYNLRSIRAPTPLTCAIGLDISGDGFGRHSPISPDWQASPTVRFVTQALGMTGIHRLRTGFRLQSGSVSSTLMSPQ